MENSMKSIYNRSIITTALIIGATQVSKADVPYGWTTYGGMGVTEVSVEVKPNEYFQFVCNNAGFGSTGNPTKDLQIEFDGRSFANKTDTLQFLIDGQVFQLPGQGTSIANGGLDAYGNFNSFYEIVSAISNSKSSYFQFQIPEDNFSTKISTLGAAQPLEQISSCDKKA